MKLWIDDVRPAPKGYVWCKSVDEAKKNYKILRHYDTFLYTHTQKYRCTRIC